jgi:CRP-like cAMP-binding protein
LKGGAVIEMDVKQQGNALIRKLQSAMRLADEDVARLTELCREAAFVEGGRDLIGEGDATGNVHLVLEGLACRYKILPDGKRSIVALLVPGDFCDLNIAILGRMDHSIATMERSLIVRIPRHVIDNLIEEHPRLTRALWWCSLVDEATLREWLVNLGRRPAARRMAHFFCELYKRLEAVGRLEGDTYHLPLSQGQLADVVGMSGVHTNRTLQELRRKGLVSFERNTVSIPGFVRLARFAEFDPGYLHLGEAS